MLKNFEDTFYWQWSKNFYEAFKARQIYQSGVFDHKQEQYLFFQKMTVEVFPSYYFWLGIKTFLEHFPTWDVSLKALKETFKKNPEKCLKELIVDYVLPVWNCLPQILRDFYKYYPKYNVPFDDVEFTYLDFWSKVPKVLESLLGELLILNDPFKEVVLAKDSLMNLMNYYTSRDTFPASTVNKLSREELATHIIEFLLGEDPEKLFFQVISLYLKHRPLIKEKCLKDLQDKGLDVTEEALVKYFLGYYIFKGVSLEALRFVVANSDLNNKNPFKIRQKTDEKTWSTFTEEERQVIINRSKAYLEESRKKVEVEASKTHEEKVAERLALLKELEKEPEDAEELKIAFALLNTEYLMTLHDDAEKVIYAPSTQKDYEDEKFVVITKADRKATLITRARNPDFDGDFG